MTYLVAVKMNKREVFVRVEESWADVLALIEYAKPKLDGSVHVFASPWEAKA